MDQRAGSVVDPRAHERRGLRPVLPGLDDPGGGRRGALARGGQALPGVAESVAVGVLAVLGLGAEPLGEGRRSLPEVLRRIGKDGVNVIAGHRVEEGVRRADVGRCRSAVQHHPGQGRGVVRVAVELGAGGLERSLRGGVCGGIARGRPTPVGHSGTGGGFWRGVGAAAQQRSGRGECGDAGQRAGAGMTGAALPGPGGHRGSTAPDGHAGYLSAGRRRRCPHAHRPRTAPWSPCAGHVRYGPSGR